MNPATAQQLEDLPPNDDPRFVSAPPIPKRVLVAFLENDGSAAIALQRGLKMAKTLDAELYALRVLPSPPWIQTLFRPASAGITSDVARAAAHATHEFCEVMLARSFASERVVVRVGPPAEVITAVADEIDASLIVLGPDSAAPQERRAKHLMRSAGRPVLIARSAEPAKAIVAATDFSDWSFPALRRAADLGARLGAPVTFMHNVDVNSWVGSTGFFNAAFFAESFRKVMLTRSGRLRRLAQRLGSTIDTVILDRDRPTDAILEVARLRDAELVVIGTHRPRPFDSLIGDRTADTIATASDLSVLAVPLGSGPMPVAACL